VARCRAFATARRPAHGGGIVIRRMTVAEVATETRRHYKTVLSAVEVGELHGTQSGPKGRWSVREDCAEAWADRVPCEHQQKNVTPIRKAAAS
jgi:hypothetical protein